MRGSGGRALDGRRGHKPNNFVNRVKNVHTLPNFGSHVPYHPDRPEKNRYHSITHAK